MHDVGTLKKRKLSIFKDFEVFPFLFLFFFLLVIFAT